jgi:hypothetical protein
MENIIQSALTRTVRTVNEIFRGLYKMYEKIGTNGIIFKGKERA